MKTKFFEYILICRCNFQKKTTAITKTIEVKPENHKQFDAIHMDFSMQAKIQIILYARNEISNRIPLLRPLIFQKFCAFNFQFN